MDQARLEALQSLRALLSVSIWRGGAHPGALGAARDVVDLLQAVIKPLVLDSAIPAAAELGFGGYSCQLTTLQTVSEIAQVC